MASVTIMPEYTPDEWATLTDLLGDALDLPISERDAFLARACAGNRDLEARVRELLDAHQEAETGGRFEAGATHLLADVFPDDEAIETVGPYRLKEEIGRGGMGRVWLADRADGVFEQRVAVKMMYARVTREEDRRRFAAERRILARLDHPNVVRIIDGGIADNGQPYLVMEHVEGESITEYCRRSATAIDERLDLMRAVCEAVAAAHRQLVVHRDLKPSNILVTDDGTVKLLDFGIAKLLAGDDDDLADLPLTVTAAIRFTPEYAAPEQVLGEPVTTATDVYALGVVLYELLTGERPYPITGRSPTAIARTVTETQVRKPSTVVRSGAGVAPDALPRRLRGDLDTIVLKALRKEPERRYASAADLAADLRHHLEGRPVSAQPDSRAYRMRKFVGRNRTGVAASVIVLAALVAALVISLVQMRTANIERDKAEAVSTFLRDMLAAPDPYADGPSIRVVDVLDRAGGALEAELGGRSEIEAVLRKTLGTSYLELGLFEQAETHLQRALALLTENPSGDALPDAMAELGGLYKRIGDFSAADSLFTLALAVDRRRHGATHPRVADRIGSLAGLRWDEGNYEDAETLMREALQILERQVGPDDVRLATHLGHLGTLRSSQGHLDEAEELYRRALELLRTAHGEQHPEVALTISHIAIIRDDLEDHETAARLHEEALALYRIVRGENHPDVAYALNNLANVETKRGNLPRADSLQQASIAINKVAVGDAHPTIGIQYNNLGSLRRRQGDEVGALASFERAIDIWREALSPEHPYLAFGLQNAGAVHLAADNPADALPLLDEAYRIRVNLLAADNPDRANSASLLGEALARLGRQREADSLLITSHAVLQDAFGDEHATTRHAAERLERWVGG